MLIMNTKRGFTLIELLVVIAVIGILTALLLANFVGIRGRASDTKKKNDANQLKKALQLFHNDFQFYPPSGSGGSINGCGTGTGGGPGTSVCSTTFSTNGVVYMKDLPTDFEYYNGAATEDEAFVIVVELSNLSDESIQESQTRCATSLSDESITFTDASNKYVVCED